MYSLFVDLDGVLVDFSRGVRELLGKPPEDFEPKYFWAQLTKVHSFYEYLPWMPEGKELWEYLLPYEPQILTGLPRGNWAEAQKRAWCKRELGEDVSVITCFASQKAQFGREYSSHEDIPILIDDRSSLRSAWEDMGGIFIHYENKDQALAIFNSIDIES